MFKANNKDTRRASMTKSIRSKQNSLKIIIKS